MNRNSLVPLRRVILVFVMLNVFFLLGKDWLIKKNVDTDTLVVGNMLLFLVTLVSFLITRRSFSSNNPNAFVRAMYGSFIIKFFVLVIAAFVYIQMSKQAVNKPALFACMGLYIFYTAMEVAALTKLLRKKKDA